MSTTVTQLIGVNDFTLYSLKNTNRIFSSAKETHMVIEFP